MRNDECPHPKTTIRLHRGVEPRTVRILVETRLTEPDRLALSLTVDAFLAAVDSGLFGRGTVSGRTHRIEVRRQSGVMADVFEARFSRIAPEAFAVIVWMIAASVPGVTRIEIRELHRDERSLVVTGFERDTEEQSLAHVSVPYRLGGTSRFGRSTPHCEKHAVGLDSWGGLACG